VSIILLTLASCLAVLLLLGLVAIDLRRIITELDDIGGASRSYLAKIRFGLRAIDTETAQLTPQVTALNAGLRALDGGLRAVAGELTLTLAALKKGGGA
jgi:hypothetical protein